MTDPEPPEVAVPGRRSTPRRLAIGLALSWLLYVAGFEAAVRSGLAARFLNSRPHKLAVSFESAHSWFPFWATATGVEARGQAPNLRWQAHVDRASGWLIPWRLAARRLRLAGAHAEGLEFRALLEPGTEDPALPTIPPLAAPPSGPQPAPRWTIELSDYDASGIRELWLDRFRITTEAQASGALTLRLPTREIEIAGSRIAFQNSRLTVGDQVLGEDLAGGGELALSVFPYREVRGFAALGHVTADVRVAGRVSGGRFWFASLPPQAWLTLDDAPAEVSGEVRLVAGELQPGTRLEFHQEDYAMRAFDFHVGGDVAGSFVVSAAPAGKVASRAEGRVTFSEFSIRRGTAQQPDIVGTGLSVVATTTDLQLARLATIEAEAHLDMGQARVPDLAVLSDLMPASAGVALMGGSGAVGGTFDVDLPELSGRGAMQIDLDDVQVRYDQLDLHGRMRLDLALATSSVPAGRFELSGSRFALTEFRSPQLAQEVKTIQAPAGDEGWWAQIELPQAEISMPPQPTASGSLRVKLRDSVPFIGLFETRRNLPRWVERILTVHDLEAESGFGYGADEFTMDEFTMDFKRVKLRARVRFGKEHKTGILLVGWGKLHLGLRLDDLRRRFKLLGASEWYAAQRLDLPAGEAEIPTAEAFSPEALEMVSFSGLGPEPLSLSDAEGEDAGDGASSPAGPPPFEILSGSVVLGDLDRDGRAEAALLLSRAAEGAPAALFLAVLDEHGGRPENVATVSLGARSEAGRLRIESGYIVLEPPVIATPEPAGDEAAAGLSAEGEAAATDLPVEESQPLADPDAARPISPAPLRASERWRLSGGKLEAVSDPPLVIVAPNPDL